MTTMKNHPVTKAVFGLVCIGFALCLMSMMPQGLGRGQNPVIKRMSTFRGDHYPSFAEFRVHEIEFNDFGQLRLAGTEPYIKLVNVAYITEVYRYEDAKETDYSTLMFLQGKKQPMLIRQDYDDVCSSIRKSMEGMVRGK
jgi:hypothetical protein